MAEKSMADVCEKSIDQAWNLADYLQLEKIQLGDSYDTEEVVVWERGSKQIERKTGYFDYHRGYTVFTKTQAEPLTNELVRSVVMYLSDRAYDKAFKEEEARMMKEQHQRICQRVAQIAEGSR